MRISNGQILRADASALAAAILSRPSGQSREALELAERVKVIRIALAPAAAEPIMDHELTIKELRAIVSKITHLLDNTTDVKL